VADVIIEFPPNELRLPGPIKIKVAKDIQVAIVGAHLRSGAFEPARIQIFEQ